MHKCTQEHNSHCTNNTKKIILNSFVFSHVQYSSVLVATINQNLITPLEKQLSWAIEDFFTEKFDSSSDLKKNLDLLPISLLFTYRAATCCHGIIKKRNLHSQAQLRN